MHDSHIQRNEAGHIALIKFNSKWIKNTHRKHRENKSWHWFWQWAFGYNFQALKKKNNQVELYQTKKLLHSKSYSQQKEANYTMEESICKPCIRHGVTI